MNKYTTISEDELDDFNNLCSRYNVDPNTFEITEHDVSQYPAGNGIFHEAGKVTITHGDKSMTYNTGHGSSWPADFEKSLNSGKFK